MKRIYIVTALAIITTVLHAADIDFLKQPAWSDVKTKAKTGNKFIFVDAYTDWCHWCKVMDKNTFSSPPVINYMNSTFVNVKMEMETGFGPTLAMKYHVSGFPSFLVLNPEGRLIGRITGYQKPEEFLSNLKQLVATPASGYPTGVSTEIELPFPDFYRKGFTVKGEKKKQVDSAEVATYLARQDNLATEVNWNVISKYSKYAQAHYPWLTDNADKLIALYGKDDVLDVVGDIIHNRFLEIAAKKDEAGLEREIYPLIDRYFRENAARRRAFYKLTYYRQQKDYAKVMPALRELTAIMETNAGNTVNDVCWAVYEESDDPAVIKQAVAEMKKVVDTDPNYMFMDTYAALLYKAKDYKAATIEANKAIDYGEKNGEDVSETKKLLDKIKAADKKK